MCAGTACYHPSTRERRAGDPVLCPAKKEQRCTFGRDEVRWRSKRGPSAAFRARTNRGKSRTARSCARHDGAAEKAKRQFGDRRSRVDARSTPGQAPGGRQREQAPALHMVRGTRLHEADGKQQPRADKPSWAPERRRQNPGAPDRAPRNAGGMLRVDGRWVYVIGGRKLVWAPGINWPAVALERTVGE